ncbi:MAG: putative 2-aminoethylphosphonate ABC transporter permease subunit [Anaerovorax sp.]
MSEILRDIKRIQGEKLIKFIVIATVLVALIVFLVMPLLILFFRAFQDGPGNFVGFEQFLQYFQSPNMRESLYNTMFISTVSMVLSVFLATVMAYCISRKNVPGKKCFQFISMLPIFAPTMLLGVCLIYIFGNQGLLTNVGMVVPIYGKVGIIIAETIFCFPVAFMILFISFSSCDYRYYEAADAMGASSLKKWITITLPNIKYGLISAMFICFTYSFTDFGAPAVVGGNYNVLATDIYKQVIGQQNFNMGAVLGILMMVPALVSFFVDRYATRKQGGTINAKSTSYVIKRQPVSDWISTGFCTVVALFMISFFLVCLFASLATMWPYDLQLTWSHYNFTKVMGDGANAILLNSLFVAVSTAIVGTIVAFMAAYVVEKVTILPRLRKGIYFLSIAPMAIPGTVVGLALVLFFNPKDFAIPFTEYVITNPVNPIYGTCLILVIANTIHYFSVPFVTASTALKKLDPEFEIVSESLRVPFYKTFVRITLPMSMGAILEMMVYFFVNAMITVSAVVFLYTPLTKTSSISILNMRDAGDIAEAAAMSMILFAINVFVRLIYEGARIRFLQPSRHHLPR